MAQSSHMAIIKRENKDDLSSKRPTGPTNHTPSKEIKRESSTPPTAVQVCPINVAQGDSTLVRLKYKGVFVWGFSGQ